jgi:hypothetical protein
MPRRIETMNAPEVLKHLETIRRALYSGQISAAKVDAQRAFESLCVELGAPTQTETPAAESTDAR